VCVLVPAALGGQLAAAAAPETAHSPAYHC